MKIGYGFKPFWFWNGDMEDQEIEYQIREMHDKGVDGFFIHPRQGLTVPYLSKTWFDKVKVAVEAAKKLNMEVWLYDEYTYPSGAAGGRVMIERPELSARELKIHTHDVEEGPVSLNYAWGKVLSACACKLVNGKPDWNSRIDLTDYIGSIYPGMAYQDSGLTFYNKKRFFSEGCQWNITWQAPEGQWRIYMCIEEEMTNFKYFGTFIDPVNPEAVRLFIQWTHEAYKKHLGHEFGKTIKGIFTDETAIWGYHGAKPWSPLMPQLFKDKNGYDILELLPALVDDIGGSTAKIRQDYFETITNAFIESYDVQLHRWCEENGILFTGEKPILRCSHLKYSHIPGIDAGHAKAGDMLPITWRGVYRSMPKIASSAAHFYHNDLAMVEAFHSMGWDATLQDLKYNIDVFAITGVNIIVPHAYFYSTDGMRKHDAPPSCFFQIPQWKHMGLLSEHLQNTHLFLKGQRCAEVLVLDQSTGFWPMGPNYEKRRAYTQAFCDLQEKLMFNMLDFYVIDTELLQESTIADKQIYVKDEPFKALIVPPMDYIDSAAQKFIAKYEQSGGCVIKMGTVDDAIKQALACVTPVLNFDSTDKILACVYEDNGVYNIFVLNTTGHAVDAHLKIRDGAHTHLNFAPFESKRIRYEAGSFTELDAMPQGPEVAIPIDRPWTFAPSSHNALRIHEWTLELPTGQKAQVESKPIINQLMDAKIPFVPEFTQGFGTAPKMHSPTMKCTYTASFTIQDMPVHLSLAIERDGILGDFSIAVNGTTIPAAAYKTGYPGFTSKTNICVSLDEYVHVGVNTLAISVDVSDNSHGVVNPVYIYGAFGVQHSKIVKRIEEGIPFKYIDNQLPYYAGGVSYLMTMDFPTTDAITLTLPDNLGLDVTVYFNDECLGTRVYSPYKWHVPSELIQPGCNEVDLEVYTGISALFEGEYVEPVTHEIVKIPSFVDS